jgi:hypothetical protein
LTSKNKWLPSPPSVFTPFLRRFTDEKSRDIADTRKLLREITARHSETNFAEDGLIPKVAGGLLDEIEDEVPLILREAAHHLIVQLMELEKPIFSSVPSNLDLETLSLTELVDLRRFLRSQEHVLDNSEKVIETLAGQIVGIIGGIVAGLPKLDNHSPFTIPLVNLLPNPKALVNKIMGSIYKEQIRELGLFADVHERIDANYCRAYGLVQGQPVRKVLTPIEDMDWSPQEVADALLKGTPFHAFLMTPVPLKFDYQTRFSHTHIVGGSGAGKTQLLQNLILHDLQSDDCPSLIIVDSQGDLINKLSHLEMFNPAGGDHAMKLTIISPREIDFPPAINIFDINKGRLDDYSPAMREQVMAGVIQTFDYLFTGLLGADLTAKQSVFFRFVARLMLALPETMGRNATILDMMNLMDNPAPYRDAIKTLPPIQRAFFERDFQAPGFRQTKEQIRYRLQSILENPTLARLFTSTKTKIDIFEQMNSGGIILIDTAKDFLKDGSAHFGRIFISLVLQAALERASIPENRRKPAFLIVDEASDYFDDNIDDLLTQVRKYSVGCVFAHQFLDQCTSSLRSSLAANTSTKLCAAVSVSDARSMAPELRTTAEHILSQKKLHFSCFVRNVTPEAVSIPVKAGLLEACERMTEDDFELLTIVNRSEVSTGYDPDEEAQEDAPDDVDPVTSASHHNEAERASSGKSSQGGRSQPIQPAKKARVPPKPKGAGAAPKPTNTSSKPQDDPNEPSSDW